VEVQQKVATCVVTLSGNGGSPVTDGTVIVQLEEPSSSAILRCAMPGCQLAAGGTASNPLQLRRGCNQVALTSPQGTPMWTVLGLITPGDSVVSIWRFSNVTKQYQTGLFADPQAPADFSVTGGVSDAGVLSSPPPGNLSNLITEAYFVCLVRPAGIPSS
jgi:hypothetical protein